MKKAVVFIFCALLFLICACESGPTDSRPTDSKSSKTVVTLVDYYDTDTTKLPWDSYFDMELPEYSGVIFRWSSQKLYAIKDGVQTTLLVGMPIWNVFVADLNDDNKPEFCATVSVGSGIVDNRAIIIDYANDKLYEISARMRYDYHITRHDNELIITRIPYAYEKQNTGGITGSISFKDGQLIVEYTNGETEIIDAID